MQKIILMVVGLLVLSGCASLSQTATPESAQRFVKLRGYEPDEKGFFAAVQARDLMAINAFFDAGINGNAQDGDGRTALSYAAARGDLEIVNALLSRGVDPNIKDKLGYTALSHAVDAKYDEVVDVLLNRSMLDPKCSRFEWETDLARVCMA